MKTKIIYISGSEVFEMSDVRAAFDEVRNALGLGRDTVLFGVPVDNDDALATTQPMVQAKEITAAEPIIIDEPAEITVETITQATEEIATPEQETIIPQQEIAIETPIEDAPAAIEETPAPVKKSRGRPRKITPIKTEDEIVATEESVPAAPSEKVIPILSVLAANTPAAEPASEFTSDEDAETPEAEVEEKADALAEETSDTVAESVSIDDMIAAQAPEEPIEKTLEQLLESMTPLREDHGDSHIASAPDVIDAAMDIAEEEIIPAGDADATLEQLAAEFASTEDKIAAPAPTQSQGKIGKLKNILPFKKARREDTGLMGDLFGWAGVAANDEDFTIPGFFTTAAKK